MKARVYTIFTMLLMLALTACEHKDLCFDHAHTVNVNVVFDWRYAPDASPASMAVYLFPADGSEPLRYDFTNREGGVIRVPIGHYDAICMNSDTRDVFTRNTNTPQTFEIFTRPASLIAGLFSLGVRADGVPRADGTENENVASPPEMLWTDNSKERIVLRLTDVSQTITFYPGQVVCNYDVEIRNAQNLKYTSGVSFAISTLAGGYLPYINKVTEEAVTVPFDGMMHQENSTVTGATRTFGYSPTANRTHKLTVYAVLADESKWYYTYDVTDQIHNAPDPRNVHIVLDGLPLPKPIVNGGGFKPTVKEWQSVDVNIDM